MPKYVHLMPHISTIYNRQIIDMINQNPKYFNKTDHVFVIANKDVYSRVKEYTNTVFDNTILHNHHSIEKHAKSAQYIILHENQSISLKTMLQLRRSTLNKIVWCVWGHDLYTTNTKQDIARIIKRTIRDHIRKYIINHFYAIGIGFKYDAIIARQKYKKPKIVYTPYGYIKGQKAAIDSIISTAKPHQYTRIMIGHSAYPFLNHEAILKKLSKYKDENIKISLVLSYGDPAYATRVQNYAYQLFDKDKVEVINKMMQHQEYLEYLQSIDICILDFPHQAALGNFYILCYMNKKLFLNDNGILKHASDAEKMETYSVGDIDKMDFSQFRKKLTDVKNEHEFGLFYIDDLNYLKTWKDTLEHLA